MSVEEKRAMIDKRHKNLSLRQQCGLLRLHRSNVYYIAAQESEENQQLMRVLDEEYTKHPFKGVLRMEAYLRDLGYCVNKKRVRRLLRLMGLEALYPKKNTSRANPAHKKYPYLLKDLHISKPNHVWCSDITYGVPGVQREQGCLNRTTSLSGIFMQQNKEELSSINQCLAV